MAKELTNTLQVDNEVYNINAVQAERVSNPLNIYKSNLNKKATKLVEYDGSTAKNVEIVPASGGSFSGRITVPDVSEATLKSDGETVLNYNSIVNKVVEKLINTSTMATWDSTVGTPVFTNYNDASINGLCVVKGTEADLNSVNAEQEATGFLQLNFDNKWLPDFLYICIDTGNIYLGTADSVEATRLAVSADNAKYADHADTANRLKTARSMKVDLASDNMVSTALFDGTADVALSVENILLPSHGGTGKNNLNDVTVGTAQKLSDTDGTITVKNIQDMSSKISAAQQGISEIINGPTVVNKAKTATNITTHTSTGNGAAVKASYSPTRIIISTAVPTSLDGNDGDIWIKY
jgi:hypothetical protein